MVKDVRLIGQDQAVRPGHGKVVQATEVVLQGAEQVGEVVALWPERRELVAEVAQGLEGFPQVVALDLGQQGQVGTVALAAPPCLAERLSGKRANGSAAGQAGLAARAVPV